MEEETFKGGGETALIYHQAGFHCRYQSQLASFHDSQILQFARIKVTGEGKRKKYSMTLPELTTQSKGLP